MQVRLGPGPQEALLPEKAELILGDRDVVRRDGGRRAPRTDARCCRSVVASQVDFHRRFGGVVPEIASRKHVEAIVGRGRRGARRGRSGLRAISRPSPSRRAPDSSGALVVGVAYAKGLALATGLPLVGVNHLEGPSVRQRAGRPVASRRRWWRSWSRAGTRRSCTCPRGASTTRWARRSTTRPARPSTRSRRRSGSAIPAGRSSRGWRREGDRGRDPLPARDDALGHVRLLAVRTQDGGRELHRRRGAQAGREVDVPDLAASFQPAVIDVQVAKSRAGGRGVRRHDLLPGGRGRREHRAARGAWRGTGRSKGSGCASRHSSCAPTTRR